MREIIVDSNISGSRLDKIALKFIGNAPMSFVYKMLRKKNITLNGKKASGNELLKDGDSIKIFISEDTFEMFSDKKSSVKSSNELKQYIIFEDDNIIALNKPAGMLSQKSKADDRSINELLIDYLGSNSMFTPGISNRLDRNTSGIMLAGKDLASSRLLNEAIKTRKVSKYYLCIVKGVFERSDIYRAYLTKDDKTNTVKVSDAGSDSDLIITGFKPLITNGKCTLVEADLITGRPHQIRAHLSYLGYPIAGDTKYGDSSFNDYFKDKYKLKWQFLHAYKLEFNEMTEKLSYLNGSIIKAPLSDKYKQILKGEKLWQPGVPED